MYNISKKLLILWHNLLALKNLYSNKTSINNLPTYFWIEPTNHCNLHCIMCPTGTGKINVKKGFMSFSLYKKIIDEIKDFASAITLAVHGESLLHNNFITMVKYAHQKNIKVLLNTNGTLLTNEITSHILDSGIDYISFAFDGFNKSSYEKARRGANYEKTLANIIYFLQLKKHKKANKPYTVLSMLDLRVSDYTEEEKKVFLSKLDHLVDEVRIREVATWGKTFKDSNDFNHRKNNNVYLPCSRLWGTVTIAWDGTVLPCIYLTGNEYILGNIKKKTLREIWNDKPIVDLRSSMIGGRYLELLPICENCIVTGTPPLLGIPSGLRLTISDAITNFMGYGFEKLALSYANRLRGGHFTSKTIGMEY